MVVAIIDEDIERVLEKIKFVSAILGLGAIGGGSVVSWKIGVDIFIGWFLMALNLEILGWQLKRMFGRKGEHKVNTASSVVIKCYLRFLVLVAIIWAIVKFGVVNPLALSVGLLVFGVSFIGVVGEIFIKMVLKRGV
ncbi:MAG: ATP synthase subunit I [Syntrophobacterales bacterium]|nr:ATP synthase subunit I [Syntrophobacterales bacterium]